MKRKAICIIFGLLLSISICSCGKDPQIEQFKKDLNVFCDQVAEIDNSINQINPEEENASTTALVYLDQLDEQFQSFAEMDFPETFDYLEPVADEAGEYMKEAVESYHEAYEGEAFDEEKANYARENSARAFKRVQVILNIIRGNNNEDVSQNDLE